VSLFITDAPAKRAPIIFPSWKSGMSPILQLFHTKCYWTQSVMRWD
jgi:hypothetical protein